jgi:hypothetical protein
MDGICSTGNNPKYSCKNLPAGIGSVKLDRHNANDKEFYNKEVTSIDCPSSYTEQLFPSA